MDLNATNQSNGRSAKPRNSYIQQPEHVVIPADPSLMQGLDSGSVEQESLQQASLQSYSSNSQLTTGPPKLEQVSSSSGRERNQAVIGGKPKPCPISQCASKGSVHRHIRYNAFFV